MPRRSIRPGDRATPLRPVVSGALLIALWLPVLLGLGPVFAPGAWLWRAFGLIVLTVAISALVLARTATGSVSARFRPGLRAWLWGAAAGTLGLLLWLVGSGQAADWLRGPSANAERVALAVVNGVAPMHPDGPFEAALLAAALLLALVSTLLFAGFRAPLAAGTVPALLLLVIPGITGGPIPWWALLGAGILLALLGWSAAPRLTWQGAISAGLAVALATGAVAILPPARDRVWNSQLLLGPVSTTVPDVTVALADDLRSRNQVRAFTYVTPTPMPVRFTLATLADFEGGRWLPQSSPDPTGLSAANGRSGIGVQPGRSPLDWTMDSWTDVTIEGLRSAWLPLPQGARGVTTIGENRFDPEQWIWTAEANTVRSASAFTRTGDRYRVAVDPIPSPESLQLLHELSMRDPEAVYFIVDPATGERSARFGVPPADATAEIVASDTDTDAQNVDVLIRGSETELPVGGSSVGSLIVGPENLAVPVMPTPLTEHALTLYPGGAGAPAELAPYLALPDVLPTALADAAARVAQDAGDRFAVGMALQDWFRGGGFAYDERAPYAPGSDPDDPYAVMTALLSERSGFCVHYAATFAVLARALGAPTRVAVGYAAQSPRPEGVVLGRDLHAWPEIYFDDLGWVPFEPTPGGAGVRAQTFGDVPASPAAPADSEDPRSRTPQEPQLPQPEQTQQPADQAQQPGAHSAPAASAWVAIPLWAALGVLLLLGPALLRWLRSARRRAAILRGADPAQPAWADFVDTAVDLRLLDGGAPGRADRADRRPRARTAEAAVEHLAELGRLSDEALVAADALARAMTAERYAVPSGRLSTPLGGSGPNRPDPESLLAALRTAQAGLRARSAPAARVGARLLPRSLRRPRRSG